MKTLNEVVKSAILGEWETVYIDYNTKNYSPKIEWDMTISDVLLSKEIILPLYKTIINLSAEVNDHTQAQERRVRTLVSEEGYLVELAWSGEQIDKELIEVINRNYSGEGHKSGSKRSGMFAEKIGVKIRIENFLDNRYIARNIIEIPTNSRS